MRHVMYIHARWPNRKMRHPSARAAARLFHVALAVTDAVTGRPWCTEVRAQRHRSDTSDGSESVQQHGSESDPWRRGVPSRTYAGAAPGTRSGAMPTCSVRTEGMPTTREARQGSAKGPVLHALEFADLVVSSHPCAVRAVRLSAVAMRA